MNLESLQEDYTRLLEISNMWMFRAKAAGELAQYLNSIYAPGSTFMTSADLRKEIEMQADRLAKMHRDKITWIKEDKK